MDISLIVERLEKHWEDAGFLAEIRQGHFSMEDGAEFLVLLSSINIDDLESIPQRFIALIWTLPKYLESNRALFSGDRLIDYDCFVTQVGNTLDSVLGRP